MLLFFFSSFLLRRVYVNLFAFRLLLIIMLHYNGASWSCGVNWLSDVMATSRNTTTRGRVGWWVEHLLCDDPDT